MTEKVKNIAVSALCLVLIGIALDLYLSNRRSVIRLASEASEASEAMKNAALKADFLMNRFSEQERLDRLDKFLVSQAAATLAASNNARKTASNLNEALKKFNLTLDTVNNRTLVAVNDRILPNAADLISAGDSMVRTTALVIAGNGNALKILTEEAALTVGQLRVLLADPAIVELLAEAAATTKEAHLTAAEVRQAIPELLAELQKIEKNAARGTDAVATYIEGFNAPSSKGGKALRFILGVLLSNARSLR